MSVADPPATPPRRIKVRVKTPPSRARKMPESTSPKIRRPLVAARTVITPEDFVNRHSREFAHLHLNRDDGLSQSSKLDEEAAVLAEARRIGRAKRLSIIRKSVDETTAVQHTRVKHTRSSAGSGYRTLNLVTKSEIPIRSVSLLKDNHNDEGGEEELSAINVQYSDSSISTAELDASIRLIFGAQAQSTPVKRQASSILSRSHPRPTSSWHGSCAEGSPSHQPSMDHSTYSWATNFSGDIDDLRSAAKFATPQDEFDELPTPEKLQFHRRQVKTIAQTVRILDGRGTRCTSPLSQGVMDEIAKRYNAHHTGTTDNEAAEEYQPVAISQNSPLHSQEQMYLTIPPLDATSPRGLLPAATIDTPPLGILRTPETPIYEANTEGLRLKRYSLTLDARLPTPAFTSEPFPLQSYITPELAPRAEFPPPLYPQAIRRPLRISTVPSFQSDQSAESELLEQGAMLMTRRPWVRESNGQNFGDWNTVVSDDNGVWRFRQPEAAILVDDPAPTLMTVPQSPPPSFPPYPDPPVAQSSTSLHSFSYHAAPASTARGPLEYLYPPPLALESVLSGPTMVPTNFSGLGVTIPDSIATQTPMKRTVSAPFEYDDPSGRPSIEPRPVPFADLQGSPPSGLFESVSAWWRGAIEGTEQLDESSERLDFGIGEDGVNGYRGHRTPSPSPKGWKHSAAEGAVLGAPDDGETAVIATETSAERTDAFPTPRLAELHAAVLAPPRPPRAPARASETRRPALVGSGSPSSRRSQPASSSSPLVPSSPTRPNRQLSSPPGLISLARYSAQSMRSQSQNRNITQSLFHNAYQHQSNDGELYDETNPSTLPEPVSCQIPLPQAEIPLTLVKESTTESPSLSRPIEADYAPSFYRGWYQGAVIDESHEDAGGFETKSPSSVTSTLFVFGFLCPILWAIGGWFASASGPSSVAMVEREKKNRWTQWAHHQDKWVTRCRLAAALSYTLLIPGLVGGLIVASVIR